jgi:hypothetical protein
MVLDEQRDPVCDPLRSEPPFGDGQAVHGRSAKKTGGVSGRRQWTDAIEAL